MYIDDPIAVNKNTQLNKSLNRLLEDLWFTEPPGFPPEPEFLVAAESLVQEAPEPGFLGLPLQGLTRPSRLYSC